MNDDENNGEKKIKRQISIMMLMMTTKTTAQFEKHRLNISIYYSNAFERDCSESIIFN